MMTLTEAFEKMTGRKLENVEVVNRDELTITLDGGEKIRFGVKGFCCSRSWIEHFETIRDIRGATIISVMNLDLGELLPDGSLKSYQTIIKTDRGEISVEYRNSSNGYYGGYLEVLSHTRA